MFIRNDGDLLANYDLMLRYANYKARCKILRPLLQLFASFLLIALFYFLLNSENTIFPGKEIKRANHAFSSWLPLVG